MGDPVSLEGFNPFSDAAQQCPHLYYEQMRRETPAFKVEGTNIFLITRHESIVPILRDTVTFSNNFGSPGGIPDGPAAERIAAVMATGFPQVATMLTIDPPWHDRYRGTVAPFFVPRRMAELREPVGQIVNDLIDSLPDDTFDLVPAFAVPLPIRAIARVLNVPTDRLDDFKRWSDDSIVSIGNIVTDDRKVEAARGIVEFQHYFAEQLEQRRHENRGDLLSELIRATVTDDDGATRPLTMGEMLSLVQQLLVAGNETTTKSITEGVRLLAEHPKVWEKLRADPAGYAPLVTEEVLRLSTPTQGMFRVVTADTEIEGVHIPKGSQLVVMYSAANRDPKVWGDLADDFDPDRPNMKDHLAFGKGVHFCLGAPLSRLELQVAFQTLATRLTSIELDESNDYRYHPSFVLRGLVNLRVRVNRVEAPLAAVR